MNNYGSLLTTMLICACCSVSRVWLCDPMDCSMPGFLVCHRFPVFAQTHVQRVGEAIQSSHPVIPFLLPSVFPSIRVFSIESVLPIRWPKVLELQHQYFPWIFRDNFLWDLLVWSPCCPPVHSIYLCLWQQKRASIFLEFSKIYFLLNTLDIHLLLLLNFNVGHILKYFSNA